MFFLFGTQQKKERPRSGRKNYAKIKKLITIFNKCTNSTIYGEKNCKKHNIKCFFIKCLITAVTALFILTAAAFSACDGVISSDSQNSTSAAEPYLIIALTEYELTRGESIGLSAIASDGSAITWTSSDESVAEVSADGKVYAAGSGTVTITASSETAGSADCEITVHSTQTGSRTLLWSDEFNGTELDTTKWGYMTGIQDHYGDSAGPWYWGNNEEQYYTEDAATVTGGNLVITATREEMPDGRSYSSARISTRDNYYTTYGYIEARIKTPAENGMWPAFWMLPQPTDTSSTQNKYGGWSTSGEIDIMEAKGRLQNKVDTTLHFSQYGVHAYRGTTYTRRPSTNGKFSGKRPQLYFWITAFVLILLLDLPFFPPFAAV